MKIFFFIFILTNYFYFIKNYKNKNNNPQTKISKQINKEIEKIEKEIFSGYSISTSANPQREYSINDYDELTKKMKELEEKYPVERYDAIFITELIIFDTENILEIFDKEKRFIIIHDKYWKKLIKDGVIVENKNDYINEMFSYSIINSSYNGIEIIKNDKLLREIISKMFIPPMQYNLDKDYKELDKFKYRFYGFNISRNNPFTDTNSDS